MTSHSPLRVLFQSFTNRRLLFLLLYILVPDLRKENDYVPEASTIALPLALSPENSAISCMLFCQKTGRLKSEPELSALYHLCRAFLQLILCNPRYRAIRPVCYIIIICRSSGRWTAARRKFSQVLNGLIRTDDPL